MIYLVRESLTIKDGYITISEDEIRYLLKVRRLKEGAVVHFSTLGVVYETKLEMHGHEPKFLIVRKENPVTSSSKIIVAIAIGDINAVEESIRNGVEAGADEFYLFRAELSNTSISQIEKKMKRLSTIVVSSASQSRRGHLPQINIAIAEEIANLEGDHIVVHPYSSENLMSYKIGTNTSKILWIGPEGGFTKNEIDFFISKNFRIFSLKTPILRMENAVTVLTAFIKNLSD
ncbi:MAG TPA: RsmE family RNA methyltransferase [bacterium]|nr:RsmE family RNA methyltransferase [bacterium]HPS29608.1 RsmE family RNA methyltransferase [bacterium]